ncbi:MAG: GGDEF domain-containing protein, partial [Planctomycetota bacterium]
MRSRILFMSPDAAQENDRCARLVLAGLEVIKVGDEMESLAAVKSQHVDLAMLHLAITDTFDMDLADVLRQVAPAAYLPVVVLADEAAEQEQCKFLDCGADDVFSHDTSDAEMIARLGALLRVKDLHDQLAASRTALQQALQRERQLLAKLRKDNAYLRNLATTDALTHVQNVRSFKDILEHEFKIAKRYGQSLSLLVLDMDHFKIVNDVHGHPSGDYVLKETAVILKQSVRESDVVARTGGEEFTILLPKADPRQACRFAERIRHEVRSRKFSVYGRKIRITASVGLATYPADAEIADSNMLVFCADQALLVAK